MTQVQINLARRMGTGAEVKPTGEVWLRPWQREVSSSNLVLPAPFVVPLHRSMPTAPIVDLDHRWLWRVEERVPGGTTQVVRVPAGGLVQYSSLEVINPDTLEVLDTRTSLTAWMDAARAVTTAATTAATTATAAADRAESAASRSLGRISMPDWVTAALPCQFERTADNLIGHTHQLTQHTANAQVLWVAHSGNDVSNTGTEAAPYRSLGKAWTEANTRPGNRWVIRLAIDTLTPPHAQLGTTAMAPGRSIAIIGANSTPTWVTSLDPGLTWAQDGANTWRASRTLVRSAWSLNRDANGVPYPLRSVTSLAEVQATPGSWYTDDASVWINSVLQPTTASHAIVLAVPLLRTTVPDGATLYVDNLTLLSGGENLIVGPGRFVANNCRFVGGGDLRHHAVATSENALTLRNTSQALLFGCVAAHAPRSGFAHISTSPLEQARGEVAALWRCRAYGCGVNARASRDNSAYGAQGGLTVVRVSCDGWRCYGPILADGATVASVSVDCHMRDSAATPPQPAYNYGAGTLAWLEDCLAGGTTSTDITALAAVDIRGRFGGHRLTAPAINYHR